MATAGTLLENECDYVDSVPVFDEHSEYDGSSDIPVRTFSKERLEAAAEYANNRAEKRGHYGAFGPGHTILRGPDGLPVPEAKQPPVWGFHREHYVAPHPGDGTPCLWVKRYAKRGLVPDGAGGKVDVREAMKEYPYASVEYWTVNADGRKIPGFVDRVAILKQPPKRECGVLMFSKGAVTPAPKTRTLYADPAKITPLAAVDRGNVLFYAMESPTMIADPALDPGANSPNAALINELIEALKARYPNVFMEAEPTEAPLDAPGGDLSLPGGLDAPGGDMPAAEPAMFAKGNKNPKAVKNIAISQNKEIAALQSKLQALMDEREAERLTYSKADAERRVSQLQRNGKSLDFDREVSIFAKLPIEERDAHEEYIVEHYASTNQYFDLPPAEMIDHGPPLAATVKGKGQISDVKMDQCLQYVREGKGTFDDAVNHYVKAGK